MMKVMIGTTLALTASASVIVPFPFGVKLTPIAIARFLASMAAAGELATACSTVNRRVFYLLRRFRTWFLLIF